MNMRHPINTIEERIVKFNIQYIWIFYFSGLLYLMGSSVGWILMLVFCYRFIRGEDFHIHWLVYVWITAMLVQLLTIFVAHVNHELGMSSLIKSSIGWAKGWSLMGIFPLIASLKIRSSVITKSMMTLAKWTLYITPIVILAALLKLPSNLYVSPLKFLASISFFEVELYGLNASTGFPRWRLFTPWGPALGLYGNLLLAFCFSQKQLANRGIGITAALIMITLSQSRMGMLCCLLIPCFCFFLFKLKSLRFLIIVSILSPILFALIPLGLEMAQDFLQYIHSARADSSRVRAALERIALERWLNEAPIWGHGIVEIGNHYVEYMPIGSHLTWLGLLFVKGIVGFIAFAIPLVVTIIWLIFSYMTTEHQSDTFYQYRTALHLSLTFSAYSFTENLEILAYLHWPALLYISLCF